MTRKTKFGRIGIDGVGLLGGSLGLALKQRELAETVVGVGRNRSRLERALKKGLIDEIRTHDELSNVAGPPWDILVLAAPVRLIAPCLKRHIVNGLIGAQTAVTDVGSTKAVLQHDCIHMMGGLGPSFVGAHPIAGSEKSGADYADAELYKDRITVLTPGPKTSKTAITRIQELWESVGSRIIIMSPERHDALLAASSHLPHVTAAALCAMVQKFGNDVEDILGTGFRDATRIASGSPEMWRDISLHNSEALAAMLDNMRSHLGELADMIRQGDEEALLNYFKKHREWRDRLFPSNGGETD